jgi:pyridoxamine 5'-phosphate oxidase
MSPLELFEEWFAGALSSSEVEPNAMVLSTVNSEGRPNSRVVLLKRTVEGVYYFFTNYGSDKSQALNEKPYASLNFHWRQPLHRQVRIEGSVIRASREISEEYFHSRPRGSQIGAWASPQSQVIPNRANLEERVKMYEESFKDKEVPLPEFWGGFGVVPERMEFWQAGENRLHTRRLFVKNGKTWQESLLAP